VICCKRGKEIGRGKKGSSSKDAPSRENPPRLFLVVDQLGAPKAVVKKKVAVTLRLQKNERGNSRARGETETFRGMGRACLGVNWGNQKLNARQAKIKTGARWRKGQRRTRKKLKRKTEFGRINRILERGDSRCTPKNLSLRGNGRQPRKKGIAVLYLKGGDRQQRIAS